MLEESLNKVRHEIDSASDKSLPRAIHSAAEKYDDLMLEYQMIPDEGIRFLLAVLSDERVLRSRGIEHFLLEINVDFCKYTQEQRGQLLATLLENACRITDQLGRHSVGDLIARAYPAELAIAAFQRLSAGSAAEKHVAFVGLDVLRMREPKDSTRYPEIERKWLALLNSKGTDQS